MNSSEMLYYGGIAVMASSCGLAFLSAIAFAVSGRILNKKLRAEYGEDPRR